MKPKLDALVRLAHIGMHPDRLRKLIADRGDPVQVLSGVTKGTIRLPPAAREAATVPAEQRLAFLEAKDIRFISASDASYPDRLRELPDAPLFLFHRGGLVPDEAIAIVGTRACTTYGRRLAERYGAAVSNAGWSVVSGLAKGIDGAAHRGSLQGSTRGVAVLGSGVDVWYPRLHRELGESLLEAGGAILSEYPPGARPLPWRFPPRNRIISGLSKAVIVVEAGVKGGALVTARIALEQGRDIYATPGDVGRAASVGCNLLIRDGAFPVLDSQDLLECLELALGPRPGQGELLPTASQPDLGQSVAEYVASLNDDPVAGMAELGRLLARGAVSIDGDGMVVAMSA